MAEGKSTQPGEISVCVNVTVGTKVSDTRWLDDVEKKNSRVHKNP